MEHVERSIEIKASQEKVWLLITNFERIPEIAPEIKKFEIISDRRSGVGDSNS